MIDSAAELDLNNLVHSLRQASEERARIPAHSGTVTKEKRKDNRKRRRQLKDKISLLEREVISWALAQVPVDDAEMELDTNG